MTRRQFELLGQLVTFCERCGSPDLPLRIDRVDGYGSFFRGKEWPGDVDLIATTGSQHPLFPKFRELMGQEVIVDKGFLTPATRMEIYADFHEDSEVVWARPLFASWLKGLSDHKLLGHSLPLWMSPSLYTQHLLRASLPGVKVGLNTPDEGHHVQVVHEVWSPERTDVRGRVEQLWARDMRDDLLKEGVWFETQARALLLQVAILDRVAERLVTSPIKAEATTHNQVRSEYVRWLRTTELGFPPELIVDTVEGDLDFGRPDLIDPPDYRPPNLAALPTTDLSRAVEDKREELRTLDERVLALRDITRCLAFWTLVMKKVNKDRREFLVRNARVKGVDPEVVRGELVRLGLA